MSELDEAEFAIEMVELDTLRPHPRNYNGHPDDQVEHLIASLRQHKFYKNVVVANDGTILAGHGIVQAARRVGVRRVPVHRLPYGPDDPEAWKVLSGDNEIARLRLVDDRGLADLLKETKERSLDGLLGTGFDDMKLANLVFVTRPKSEIEDFNEAAEWVGMPDYDEGEKAVKLILTFDSAEARAELMRELGLVKSGANGETWSAKWPPQGRKDRSSVKFE